MMEEPECGFNLPPGCHEADPNAPWNRPDAWVGMACNDCRFMKRVNMHRGGFAFVCAEDVDDLCEVLPGQTACELFERD